MIQSRVPYEEYASLPGVSITRLKEMKRSPQHYKHRLAVPHESAAMTLGTAAHCAVLEPERFDRDFAVWGERTDGGNLRPRRGKDWEAFAARHADRTIITVDEYDKAIAIQAAVRGNALAMRYLESGDPEVTLQWELGERACKGRVDWLTTVDGLPALVGLKTARDCRPFIFGSAAAKLGYHLQWAFYFDGYNTIARRMPRMVEIVVENDPPHAVAVFRIPSDIVDQGREEYEQLLKTLDDCAAVNAWPGPVTTEEFLTLPTWAYERDADDVDGLGLEVA
jgi:hypothetical protein